jgi:hypothetical protein
MKLLGPNDVRIKTVLYNTIELMTPRSAWNKGVQAYALELLDDDYIKLETVTTGKDGLKSLLLNGAQNWREYSYGGCSLIYDNDIAERLCSPSELKSRNGGNWQPSKRENWLDCQARALSQAFWLIYQTWCDVLRSIDIQKEGSK